MASGCLVHLILTVFQPNYIWLNCCIITVVKHSEKLVSSFYWFWMLNVIDWTPLRFKSHLEKKKKFSPMVLWFLSITYNHTKHHLSFKIHHTENDTVKSSSSSKRRKYVSLYDILGALVQIEAQVLQIGNIKRFLNSYYQHFESSLLLLGFYLILFAHVLLEHVRYWELPRIICGKYNITCETRDKFTPIIPACFHLQNFRISLSIIFLARMKLGYI